MYEACIVFLGSALLPGTSGQARKNKAFIMPGLIHFGNNNLWKEKKIFLSLFADSYNSRQH
jgi:hypothetical protein